MKVILASLLLSSVAFGGVLPAKRQTATPPTPLAVYSRRTGTLLGNVLATIGGASAALTPGSGSLFSFEAGSLFGPADGTGAASHAVVIFPSLEDACELISGNLTFAVSSPSDCASPGPFRLEGDTVQFTPSRSGIVRSFQLCGADKHIAWNRFGSPTDGCEDVVIVLA